MRVKEHPVRAAEKIFVVAVSRHVVQDLILPDGAHPEPGENAACQQRQGGEEIEQAATRPVEDGVDG
jgi:hypothetical protein